MPATNFGAGALCILVLCVAAWPASATPGQGAQDELKLSSLSLEDLAQVPITSVSRRPEALAEAAAAVFVINREDIRRSGATSLPEVLRLAPNLNVQRVNAGDYAISARGFNGFETSNKLLVLVDGRSVYSVLASGVFWDERTVMLEDIERIEIISGPGGALYGANAVNGVINITTRRAADTRGPLISAGVGTEDNTLSVRYGAPLGETGDFRVYVNAFDRDGSEQVTGLEPDDSLTGVRAGFRADWGGGDDRFTLQGDAYDKHVLGDIDIRGGNVLGRWTRDMSDRGVLEVQAYVDSSNRHSAVSDERIDTIDLDVQHSFGWGDRHRFVWGGGYRVIDTEYILQTAAFLDPPQRTVTLANLFVQDQIALTSDLTLTLGLKVEDSSLSGQSLSPSVRLGWARPDGNLLWGAISSAARTPNLIERGLTLAGFLVPGDFQDETVLSYEVGYRARPTPNASLSISAFYNDYDGLRSVAPDPDTVFPLSLANGGKGDTLGVEAWGAVDVTPRWRLTAGLATLRKSFRTARGEVDISDLVSTGDDPEYQLLLGSRADLTDAVSLDVRMRAVDSLATTDSYVEADARLGWRLTDRLELSVTGSNLLEGRHFETGDPARRRAFGRSVHAAIRVGF